MKLSLAISPCPNDTFMFDALLNGRIDTEGLEFEPQFADIDELNATLTSGRHSPAVSKASYAIIPKIKERYKGSALGRGNGPLLVSASASATITDAGIRVAIPGMDTTANMLLCRLFPHLSKKQVYLFSDIIPALERGECDAGVLIHEGRFVYRSHGLSLLADLGAEWEKSSGMPLPLGVIVIDARLPREVQLRMDRVLRRSIEYAMANPAASEQFVRAHASEMDSAVIKEHIALFVNDYSLDIGTQGRKAVDTLLGLDSVFIN